MPNFCNKTKSICTWRAIVIACKDVEPNIIWVTRNGHDTQFWKDNWIQGVGPLLAFLESSNPTAELELMVIGIGHVDPKNCPSRDLDKITFSNPPSSAPNDFLCWNLSPDCFFFEFSLGSFVCAGK